MQCQYMVLGCLLNNLNRGNGYNSDGEAALFSLWPIPKAEDYLGSVFNLEDHMGMIKSGLKRHEECLHSNVKPGQPWARPAKALLPYLPIRRPFSDTFTHVKPRHMK